MISSISRHLARTSSVAVASKFVRPAVTQQTNFSQRAFSSDSEEKSFGLSRKDISNIVSAEYGMSGAEAKRIVDTVFDTMVEVRVYYMLKKIYCVTCTIFEFNMLGSQQYINPLTKYHSLNIIHFNLLFIHLRTIILSLDYQYII